MCFKCAEDLYSALVRRQSALLGFLPWATAGIPRAMNGMHSWEMRTGFVLRRELAAFCDSATTTGRTILCAVQGLFYLHARLLFPKKKNTLTWQCFKTNNPQNLLQKSVTS